MANEIKKYLDLTGLGEYDRQRKAQMEAADDAVLEAAKKYTDEAPFDPAGTAQTKVNELADGQVNANKEAIDAINDASTGILKKAQEYADSKHETAMGAAGAASDAAAAAQTAADNAQTAADNAQADYNALVDETEGSKGRIPVLESKVDALIEGTYDDTEVRGLIETNADDIDALEGRADTLEDTVGTLVGSDTDKSVRTIANEELAKQLIADGAKESLDTLTEIAAWIQSHPDDASAMSKAIDDLEALVGTLPTGISATTIVGYIQEVIAAEKSRAEGAEDALSDRLDVIDGQLAGIGADETIVGKIDAAKQAAITTAAGDATTKANQALTDAKGYTDTEIDKVEKTVGDNTSAISGLDTRVGANADAIGAINTSLATGGTTANAIKAAQDAADAAQDDVDALVAEDGRIPTLEGKVEALESVTYTPITTAEIGALFTSQATA